MAAPPPPGDAKPAKKPPPRGFWRVVRWVRRLGVVALVVTLLVAGAAIAVLNTAWGRDLLRERLEHVLRDQFPGGAKIGRLEGSIFNTLTAFDIELDGRDGKPMIQIGALTIDAGLRPLASKQVRVNSLIIDGLVVDIHPQPPGPPAPPPPPGGAAAGEPSAWAIDLPQIELHDARIAFTPASGDAIHIDGLDLAASVAMPAPENGAHVAPPIAASLWMRGTWRERGPFELSTTATYDRARNEVAAPLLAVALAGASAVGVGLRVQLGDGGVTSVGGAIAMHAPRAALTAFGVPVDVALPGGGDVDAVIDVAPLVARGTPGGKLVSASLVQVAIWAAAGPAHVHGLVSADVATRLVRGVIVADDADLAALTQDRVRGHAEVIAAIEAEMTGVHGVLTVTGDVDVAPPTRMIIAVDATRDKLLVTAGAAGVDDARVAALAEVKRVGETYTLSRGRLSVRSRDPARASGGRAPVHGAVWLDAHVIGPLWPVTKLTVEADAGATALAYKALGATSVTAHVTAYNVPNRSDATVHVDLTGAHSGAAGIASASFDVHALAPLGQPVRLDLTKHEVHTLAGVVFAGAGGYLVLAPERVDVHDLETGVGASRITASGTFAPKTADFSGKLNIAELALASLAPDLAGTAAASLSIARRHGRWSGGGDVHARGLVAQPQRPPIDADVHVDVAGTHVTAHATASNAAIFAATADVDLDGPRDLTDAAGWLRLPRAAIHRVALGIERLDIDAAVTAAGIDPATLRAHGGGVTGTVELTEAGADGELDITNVTGPSGRIDAAIKLVPGDPAEIAASAKITAADVGEVVLAAHVAPPVHLLSPDEWIALDRGALRGASVTLPEQPFDPALLARFGVLTPYHGRVALTLTTTAAAASTTLAVDVREVSGGAIVKPVTLHAGTTLDDAGIAADVSAVTATTKLVAIQAHAPVTVDRIVALGARAALLSPLTGELVIDKLKLPDALAILGRSDVTAGQVDGAVTFGGTIGTPTATGTITATGVTVAPGLGGHPLPRLDELTVSLLWGGAAGTLHAVAHESDGGTLTLAAAGGLADRQAATIDLVAAKLDIAPLAALAPEKFASTAGLLDADLHLRGLDPSTGKLTGNLHLTKARVPLAPNVGTLRQLDATVTIDGPKLTVKADGLLGAGDAHVTGTIDLAGSTLHDTDLKLRLNKISTIGGIQPVISGDVDVKLRYANRKLTGKLAVTHASVVVPSTSSATKLLPMGEPSDMEFVDAPPPKPKGIHIDAPADPWLVVSVDIAPTEVAIDEIQAVVKASDLKLSIGDVIGLDGYVDMDRGDIDLFGRRYSVELGLLMFDGGTDPELSISISHVFPEVTTYTDVSGRASEPVVNLHADPANYTQGQLLGFLLGGDPSGDPSSQARDEAATIGASVVSATLSRKLNKVLPVKLAVRCNPSTSSASALCTAGKWFSPKLYIGYQQHLDPLPDENTGEGDLEFYLLNHVVIDLSAGDRNDGVDVLWRKRW